MSRRTELKNIGSISELNAARKVISKSIRQCERDVEQDVARIQRKLRPMNLLDTGWEWVAPSSLPPSRWMLGLVRGAKRLLQKV